AFFFVDYEGTRITRGVTRVTRVPTVDEKNGIFTSAIRDPLTGLPFPGNRIPANRIDPTAAGIIRPAPRPNQPGANNLFPPAEVAGDADRVPTRLDYRSAPNNSFFARYIYSNRNRF